MSILPVHSIRMTICLLYRVNCKMHGGKTRTSEKRTISVFFFYISGKKIQTKHKTSGINIDIVF